MKGGKSFVVGRAFVMITIMHGSRREARGKEGRDRRKEAGLEEGLPG